VRAEAQLTDRQLTIKLSIAQSTDRLDLSGCNLAEVPSAVFELTNLLELSLSGNQLQELPSEIGNLSNLRRLVVAGNWLTRLPEELLQLSQLEGLWVHGNLLHHVPEQLGRLSRLRHLSFAGEGNNTDQPSSYDAVQHCQPTLSASCTGLECRSRQHSKHCVQVTMCKNKHIAATVRASCHCSSVALQQLVGSATRTGPPCQLRC
jgi:hypothetical protein